MRHGDAQTHRMGEWADAPDAGIMIYFYLSSRTKLSCNHAIPGISTEFSMAICHINTTLDSGRE